MAYISQEKKKEIVEKAKPILKRFNLKGTFSIENHSTLHLTISEGPIDFIDNYRTKYYARFGKECESQMDSMAVNNYWYQDQFTGPALEFLKEIIPVMNEGNFDKSEPMADFFLVGWYVNISIGRWNKPYKLVNTAPPVPQRPRYEGPAVPEWFIDNYCDAAGNCFSDADPGL